MRTWPINLTRTFTSLLRKRMQSDHGYNKNEKYSQWHRDTVTLNINLLYCHFYIFPMTFFLFFYFLFSIFCFSRERIFIRFQFFSLFVSDRSEICGITEQSNDFISCFCHVSKSPSLLLAWIFIYYQYECKAYGYMLWEVRERNKNWEDLFFGCNWNKFSLTLLLQ